MMGTFSTVSAKIITLPILNITSINLSKLYFDRDYTF